MSNIVMQGQAAAQLPVNKKEWLYRLNIHTCKHPAIAFEFIGCVLKNQLCDFLVYSALNSDHIITHLKYVLL